MNVLITGAYGFVGTNISAFLKSNGADLSALDIKKVPNTSYSQFYSWENLDTIDFNQFHAIIHLAGKAHDTRNKSGVQVYFDINTGLTQKVFDKFVNSSVSKFIFFSSVKAAAEKVESDFLTEDIIPAPVGAYGESKIKAEEYILDQMDQKAALIKNKEVYILRPCMIHGPGNKGNLNLLYSVVSKGVPYPLGAFENNRSFLSIDNLCFIIYQLLEKPIEGGIYHLADDESLSTNELIRLISQSVNKPERVWNWNKSVITGVARLGDVLKLPLNSLRLQKLTENYVVSNQKIKKAIGVEKLPVDAASGIQATLASFK